MDCRDGFRKRLENYRDDLPERPTKVVLFTYFVVIFAIVLRIAEWMDIPVNDGNILGYAAVSIVGPLLLG